MPIRDLLWACPLCHRIESIADDGRCQSCRAVFSRGRGARIRATTTHGTQELDPVAWLAELPWPDLDGDGLALPAGLQPPFCQTARVRRATAELPLRSGGQFLGFVERFGTATTGQLELSATHLTFVARRECGWSWPLTEVTAIQPASSSIQLKARGEAVASVRFPAGSLRLWEQRLQYCVREAYVRAGKGTILEFQPHIRTR